MWKLLVILVVIKLYARIRVLFISNPKVTFSDKVLAKHFAKTFTGTRL